MTAPRLRNLVILEGLIVVSIAIKHSVAPCAVGPCFFSRTEGKLSVTIRKKPNRPDIDCCITRII